MMIARTGWDEGMNANTVVAEMKVAEYQFNEHQHLDAGGFQIYYKGGLANDTGYYQAAEYGTSESERFISNNGNTAYASAHDTNYQSRTIAHNCMLVYDPNETFAKKLGAAKHIVENDGGQERKAGGGTPKTIADVEANPNKWKAGEVLAHEYGSDPIEPDYTYLKGDISDAYSDKVSEYERSFMFLNLKNEQHPAAMVVFDRIKSSDKDFKKTWLLHTKNIPQVEGTRVVASVTNDGYNGKITLDVLSPQNHVINIVEGGDGDAWVNGTNYFAKIKEGTINEGGGSRIEISPAEANELDYFLNVMQVGDADGPEALPVQAIESDTHMGAVLMDRVVVFAKQRDRLDQDISFSFDGEGMFKITVADCMAGTWKVEKDGRYLTEVSAAEEGGVLSFIGEKGHYTIQFTN